MLGYVSSYYQIMVWLRTENKTWNWKIHNNQIKFVNESLDISFTMSLYEILEIVRRKDS